MVLGCNRCFGASASTTARCQTEILGGQAVVRNDLPDLKGDCLQLLRESGFNLLFEFGLLRHQFFIARHLLSNSG
ncbi:hypothetical protein BL243_04790 [Ralstonia solanacearum]|nr:hypothetical protein BL243_04790 [Ralstonia solanacearum]